MYTTKAIFVLEWCKAYERRIGSIAKKDPKGFAITKKIASNELTNHTKGAEYYHTLAVKPKWGPKLKKSGYKTIIIGNHIFYYKK